MKFSNILITMFVGSFLIQYFLMSPIMVNNNMYITNNLSKGYLAVIMALFMVLLETFMHDYHYNIYSYHILYALSLIFIGLIIYFYRKQIYVNDRQYLLNMIEHHSMAILTSEEILKKTDNYNIAKLAKNIISQQTDELRVMNEILKK